MLKNTYIGLVVVCCVVDRSLAELVRRQLRAFAHQPADLGMHSYGWKNQQQGALQYFV